MADDTLLRFFAQDGWILASVIFTVQDLNNNNNYDNQSTNQTKNKQTNIRPSADRIEETGVLTSNHKAIVSTLGFNVLSLFVKYRNLAISSRYLLNNPSHYEGLWTLTDLYLPERNVHFRHPSYDTL